MRYPSDHKAATRERLLDAAGSLIKEKGFGTTGVDALTASADLTAGAFYAHFRSKSELFEAVLERELARSLERFDVESDEAFATALARYVSLAHVEHPERGCPLPALTAEVARAEPKVRETFERMLLRIEGVVAEHVGSDDDAWAAIAQAVGAVMLARAMRSSASKKALLEAVHRSLSEKLDDRA